MHAEKEQYQEWSFKEPQYQQDMLANTSQLELNEGSCYLKICYDSVKIVNKLNIRIL